MRDGERQPLEASFLPIAPLLSMLKEAKHVFESLSCFWVRNN